MTSPMALPPPKPRRHAFATGLDWQPVPAGQHRGDQRPAYQAIHHGVRFLLQGEDAYDVKDNWGRSKRGGWSLEILEPGDSVQMGIPWRHRIDTDDWWQGEVKHRFDTLDEGKRYVEDVIIGRGVIDEMIERDTFPPGSDRYHLTLSRFVPNIMSQGLHPRGQEGTGVSVFDDLTKAILILWDLKNEDWAAYEGEDLALLQIDASGLLRSTVTALNKEQRINEPVPPQRITVLVDRIPWFLTNSAFSTLGWSEKDALRLLQGDEDLIRRAWVGHPEELDEILKQRVAVRKHAARSRTLWRGLHFGSVTLDEFEEIERDFLGFLRSQMDSHSRVGIHWTDDPGSAFHFALDRDPEGWAREMYPFEDEGAIPVGVILEAEVGEEHIVDPQSKEWQDLSMMQAIFDSSHLEAEVTVRPDAPVALTDAVFVWSLDDGTVMESHMPMALRTQATPAPRERSRSHEHRLRHTPRAI